MALSLKQIKLKQRRAVTARLIEESGWEKEQFVLTDTTFKGHNCYAIQVFGDVTAEEFAKAIEKLEYKIEILSSKVLVIRAAEVKEVGNDKSRSESTV